MSYTDCIFCHNSVQNRYCVTCDVYYYYDLDVNIGVIEFNYLNSNNENIVIYVNTLDSNIGIYHNGNEILVIDELFWLFPSTYVSWAKKYINMKVFL